MVLTAVVAFTFFSLASAYHLQLTKSEISSLKPKLSSSNIPTIDVFSTKLYSSPAAWNPQAVLKKPSNKTFSPLATLNYIAATVLEWSLIAALLVQIDQKLIPYVKTNPHLIKYLGSNAPSFAVALLMFFLSLRSRIFSPLNNSRPTALNDDPIFTNRLRPSWQPPGYVFAIVWSTISILRTVSSTLVYQTTGTLTCKPILAFIAQISIGDTWNTVNNVDNRLGSAFLGALVVLASTYYVGYLYYKTIPLAGFIIFPKCLWLTIATCLIYSIWRINMERFNYPSLLPSKEEGSPSAWNLPFWKRTNYTPVKK